jgi:hypothetical protein
MGCVEPFFVWSFGLAPDDDAAGRRQSDVGGFIRARLSGLGPIVLELLYDVVGSTRGGLVSFAFACHAASVRVLIQPAERSRVNFR